jgi:hypothetical protein
MTQRNDNPRSTQPPPPAAKRLLLLPFAVAAIVLAACGDNSRTDPQALSKGVFIKRADAICAKYEPRLDSIQVPQGDPAAPDAPKKLLRQAAKAGPAWASIERSMAQELRALTPPQGFQRRWDTALENLGGHRADAFDEVGRAAAEGDRKTLAHALAAVDQAGTQGRHAVQGYGFKVCGVGG